MAAPQTREHVTVQHDIAFGGIHKQRADVITLFHLAEALVLVR